MPGPVVFDLNGTLTDPAPIGDPWGDRDLGRAALRNAVAAAMVVTLTGSYRPFAELVRAGIELEVARRGLDFAFVDEAAERSTELPAWPEARSALERLAAAGRRLAVLTNSGAPQGEAALRAAGLLEWFDVVCGVDAVRAYKPHPAAYAHVLERLDARPAEVTLVAAHWWDVTGAKRAGLRTAWIARGERVLHPAAPPPDVRADDLLDAARWLA